MLSFGFNILIAGHLPLQFGDSRILNIEFMFRVKKLDFRGVIVTSLTVVNGGDNFAMPLLPLFPFDDAKSNREASAAPHR